MAATVFRNYDGGHWHIELNHASSLTSVSQTALRLFCERGKTVISTTFQLWCRYSFLGFRFESSGSYWGTNFIFSELFRSGSGFSIEVSFNDVVCESTSFLYFSWGVRVFSLISAVESFWILANLNYPQTSPEVAARQHKGLVEYSSVVLRSVSQCSGVKMWHF